MTWPIAGGNCKTLDEIGQGIAKALGWLFSGEHGMSHDIGEGVFHSGY